MSGDKARNVLNAIASALRSSRGKSFLLYLLFVVVAFVFWVFLSLDSEVQRDFDVPFEIQNIPDSVTVIGDIPSVISVSVKGKDSQLVRFLWGKMPAVKYQWEENVTGSYFKLNKLKMEGRLRDYFGQGSSIVSCRPDSLSIPFTTDAGVKVKLVVEAQVHPRLQYILSGPVKANVDSVTLYSLSPIPSSLHMVSTEPLVKNDLKDSTTYTVKVKPITNVRIIPSEVEVTVPIEPLISQKRSIPVEIVNKPEDVDLILFPSKVEVSYLVAIGLYNVDYPIRARVYYQDVRLPTTKLPVEVTVSTPDYHSLSFTPDSVDYVIEKR